MDNSDLIHNNSAEQTSGAEGTGNPAELVIPVGEVQEVPAETNPAEPQELPASPAEQIPQDVPAEPARETDEAPQSDSAPASEEKSDTEEESGQSVSARFVREREEAQKANKYRLFAALIFLLTAGGLFLGLLGRFVTWLAPSYYGGENALNGSLLGFFFSRMRNLFVNFSEFMAGDAGVKFQHSLAIVAAVLILVAVLTSLVCMFSSLVSPKYAKKSAVVSGTVSLLVYSLLFVWALCVKSLQAENFNASVIDMPVFIVTVCLFLLMTVLAYLEQKNTGLLNAGVLLFTFAICFALFFPGSFTESGFVAFSSFKEHLLYYIVVLVFLVALFVNFIVSIICLPNKENPIVRAGRYGLQFVLLLALVVAACTINGGWSMDLFQNSALLPTVILIVASLGALLLSLVGLLLNEKNKDGKAVSTVSEEEQDGDEVNVQTVREEGVAAISEEQQAILLNADSQEESEEETASNDLNETEAAAEPLPETHEPAPVSLPVLPEATAAEPQALPREREELSPFEREMLGYASGTVDTSPAPVIEETYTAPASPASASPAPTYREQSYREPSYHEPAHREPSYREPAYREPSYREQGYRDQVRSETSYGAPYAPSAQQGYPNAPKQQSYYRPTYQAPVYTDPSTQYTYDPFINTLTPQEKNEFGDLFIAHKYGPVGDLPTYHIGADNTEFFNKVWIRYAMYDMSPELKEKIFNYLKRYKR